MRLLQVAPHFSSYETRTSRPFSQMTVPKFSEPNKQMAKSKSALDVVAARVVHYVAKTELEISCYPGSPRADAG
jgi:hypothetical protein